MIAAGCDVGSMTAKVVLLDDARILSHAVVRCGPAPAASARAALSAALALAGRREEEIRCCVGTGYGRKRIPFATRVESEITCHARGAVFQVPEARMLMDIGGQDAKAVQFDALGQVLRFVYNDKCASGTGRFLEVIANALDLSVETLGPVSESATETLSLSCQCVVFAETEILSLVAAGQAVPDIVKALHRAVAQRAAALALSLGMTPPVVMAGGVAKNPGLFQALGEALRTPLHPLPLPQVNGALGAALFARDLKQGPAPHPSLGQGPGAKS